MTELEWLIWEFCVHSPSHIKRQIIAGGYYAVYNMVSHKINSLEEFNHDL